MKKSLFAAFLLASFFVAAKVNADTYQIPQGAQGDLATSEYGGVSYSTITFSTNPVLCFSGAGVIQGIIVSSNTDSRDWVTFHDSGTVYTVNDPLDNRFMKIHLSTQTSVYGAGTVTSVLNDSRTQIIPISPPIRVKRGLKVRTNVSNIELITIQWTKFGDPY